MAAPFEAAFASQTKGVESELMQIHYRVDEAIYIKALPDRVTVIFSTEFKDETDKIYGKVFLQEFVDARRQPSIQTAPQVLYSSREPPAELRGVAGLKDSDNIGYVTFVLFPRHFQGAASFEAISRIYIFRDYFHYHIKASKAYLHSRMRARVDSFLKVLNRAKPETASEQKTARDNDEQFERINMDVNDAIIIGGIVVLTGAYFYMKREPIKITPVKTMAVSVKNRSLIQKLDSLGHCDMAVLFFGSQTGTAEDLATRTQNDISSKLGIPAIVLDSDDYDMEELSEWRNFGTDRNWIVGFFLATYGEGEPTDNTADFYSWIMDGHGTVADLGEQEDYMTEEQTCSNVNYFIFGLGNRTYEHFNAIGRRLDKRLLQLGGKRIGEMGEGDDDISMEEDYIKWTPSIIKSIGSFFGISVNTESQKYEAHIPLFDIEYDSASKISYNGELTLKDPRSWSQTLSEYHENDRAAAFDAKHPYYSRLIGSKALFKNAKESFKFNVPIKPNLNRMAIKGNQVEMSRECYHLELDLGTSGLKYKTGDHVGLYGSNSEEEVAELARLLNIENCNLYVKLVSNTSNNLSSNAKLPFPQPCRIADILTHYLDILAVVKQHHFGIFSKYAQNDTEKNSLYSIFEDRDQYVNYVEKSQKNLSCILREFPSIKLPLAVALSEVLRTIAVRYYSISSSALESPSLVTVTAVVVRYPLEQKSLVGTTVVSKEGLATSWLERMHEQRLSGSPSSSLLPPLYLPLSIKTSSFRLPKDSSKPCIMVGPGTGVAPFRAFFRERFLVASQGTQVGPTWLLFGSRNENVDNLYGDEFKALVQQAKDRNFDIDLRLITAFSRDFSEKIYVQHRLKEHGLEVWKLMNNGYFYICGDAKRMAHDVNTTLESIAVEHGGLNRQESLAWIKSLRSQGRYQEDVWS